MKKYLLFFSSIYVYILLTILFFLSLYDQEVPYSVLNSSYNLIIAVTISFILLWLSIYFSDRIVKTPNYEVTLNYSLTRLLLISLLSLLLFLYFLNDKVLELDFISILNFTVNYRNGLYSGSGVFTVGVTYFLSTLLVLLLFFSKELNKRYIYTLLFLCFLCIFILGFRVLLLPLVFTFLLRFSSSTIKNMLMSLVYLVSLLLFLMTFKIAVDAVTGFERDLLESFFNALVRQKIPFLINEYSRSSSDIFYCGLPLVSKIISCSSPEVLKLEFFMSDLNSIYSGFPNLGNFSGIAIPLPVVLYNIYGPFLTIAILYCFLLIMLFFTYVTFNVRATFLFRFISLIILTRMSGALIEDYFTWMSSIPLVIIVTILLYFSIFVRYR